MASRETTKMIFQSMIALASAALGLVAALAWNDAIEGNYQDADGG